VINDRLSKILVDLFNAKEKEQNGSLIESIQLIALAGQMLIPHHDSGSFKTFTSHRGIDLYGAT
jgi:hypothetical protein